MGIDNHLKVIKEGIFGRDVRQAIHDGIQQAYDDATANGNANMEVAKARGEFDNLSDHLANIHAQLSSKSDDGEIRSILQNMASASPKGTYPNLAALKQAKPSGDTGTFITTDNKNWNYWNGSDWVSGGIYQSSAVSPYDTFAFVAGNKPINFNQKTKTIEIPGLNTYLLQGRVSAITVENVPYPSSSAWVVIDTITNKIITKPNPTATDVIVGAIFEPHYAQPLITFNGYYTIDGNAPGSPDKASLNKVSQNMIFTNEKNIVFDKSTFTLKFPKANVIIAGVEHWAEAQDLSLAGAKIAYITFDTVTKRFGVNVNTANTVTVGFYNVYNRNYVYLNGLQIVHHSKKIACLGDSITEGVNAGGWQWHRYIDQWCKENGIETTVVNLGIGGTSVCTSSYVTDTLQPFVNRLDTIPTDADVVVVFGGTNDWGNNATLGTIDDTGTSTFYGAYKHILEWLAINRPNAKVMTMTPLKRYYRGGGTVWVNAQTTPNNKGNLLQDYVRAVKEVSDLYAVPCVDLHNDSGLNPVIEAVRTKFIGDGLHPTAEGNKKMYPVILDKMRPLLEYD